MESSSQLGDQSIDPQHTSVAIQQIASRLLDELAVHAQLPDAPRSELFVPPTGDWLPIYLISLEQSLAISCSLLAPENDDFLYAERSIVDQLLHLCVDNPHNVPTRSLLLYVLEKEAKRRANIVGEYRKRVEQLHRDYPIAASAQALASAAICECTRKIGDVASGTARGNMGDRD